MALWRRVCLFCREMEMQILTLMDIHADSTATKGSAAKWDTGFDNKHHLLQPCKSRSSCYFCPFLRDIQAKSQLLQELRHCLMIYWVFPIKLTAVWASDRKSTLNTNVHSWAQIQKSPTQIYFKARNITITFLCAVIGFSSYRLFIAHMTTERAHSYFAYFHLCFLLSQKQFAILHVHEDSLPCFFNCQNSQ